MGALLGHVDRTRSRVADPVGAMDYYMEFGLRPAGDSWFSTRDGGRQLQITHAPTWLTEMSIGAGHRPGSQRADRAEIVRRAPRGLHAAAKPLLQPRIVPVGQALAWT